MSESYDKTAPEREEATGQATGQAPVFYAHSANRWGTWHLLVKHLRAVASLAAGFAGAFDASAEAELAGLLHDLGKYGDRFQRRLLGEARGIDHWSAGAWVALGKHRALAAATAIQGHHLGLQRLDKNSLLGLDPRRLLASHPLGLTLSEADPEVLLGRLDADGATPRPVTAKVYGPTFQQTAAAMLDVRMLFSTLVDADFLNTEQHFCDEPGCTEAFRPVAPDLNAEAALSVLSKHVASLARSKKSSDGVRSVRADLWRACIDAGREASGLWTLSAPTGAGKTLAMLGFALQQAAHDRELRRIVVVIPYLSIIEQAAKTYRDIFCSHFGEDYVLEHHSMTDTGKEASKAVGRDLDAEAEARRRQRLLAENWDAPLIVTTSVQLLESLFSNRPSACRKLHRLASSIILFDEVQTLPLHLALPTLATLSHLAARYRTSVVFSTATQPAFTHLDGALRNLNEPGWQPKEVVPSDLDLFGRSRRTRVHWPQLDAPVSWSEIVSRMAAQDQVLCIVNLKRHALEVLAKLKEHGQAGLCHLSTSMCPAHRQAKLAEVRGRLSHHKPKPCRLISTQCVEAGVDVDFPVVYRAFGPLDSIAQAAGRCNRNGGRSVGEVYVFLPEEERYPDASYAQAAAVTRMLLRERGEKGMDIQDEDLFDLYYHRLYDVARPEAMRPELMQAIRCQDFADVAGRYHIVDERSINVLVPYEAGVYGELADEVRREGLTRKWMRRAQPYCVSVFRPGAENLIWSYLEPIRTAGGQSSEDWFIYLNAADYQEDVGLVPPEASAVWVVG